MLQPEVVPDQNIDEVIDRELSSTPFAQSKTRMDEHVGIVPNDTIEEHLDELRRAEALFSEGINKIWARRLELTCGRGIEKNKWVGPNARVCQTHDYDDFFNHIDMVVEWALPKKNKVVRLGLDVTTSKDPEVLKKKALYTKKQLEKGKLCPVKYFKGRTPAGEEFKGEIAVPRVVINIPVEFVEAFWRDYVSLRARIERTQEEIRQSDDKSKNITLKVLNEKLAALEKGERFAQCFASAIHTSILQQISSVDKNRNPHLFEQLADVLEIVTHLPVFQKLQEGNSSNLLSLERKKIPA